MIAVVQRCRSASVRVADEVVGQLRGPRGLVVLLGVEVGDTLEQADRMAQKLAKLRIFEDANGKMNLALTDVGGSLLVISQFTLLGDCSGGNRPSFVRAARPEHAEPLFERCVGQLRAMELPVETGRFRTEMQVALVNDGPVTLLVEVASPSMPSA
jgi:D-tyrosyl-tRNA(Tyr) deacylase